MSRTGVRTESGMWVMVACGGFGRRRLLYSVLVFPGLGGSHSGLVRPPAKRVGAVEASRGFESLPLRRHRSGLSRRVGGPVVMGAPPPNPRAAAAQPPSE